MKETNVMRTCMMKVSEDKHKRVFRNNVGKAVAYDFKKKKLIKPIRVIEFGLCVGSSDLIGWKSIEITQDMVGKRVAIFTAIETKRPKKSKTSDEQYDFIRTVQSAGGIGLVAKSEKDLEQL